MKLLITCDLHQYIPKWERLVTTAMEEAPRFILIAGDLLPKTGGHQGQRDFFKDLEAHLTAIKEGAKATVLLYFGNDDHHILEPKLDELAAKGLCVNMNDRVHREEGLIFCGMNRVRDYPFGYKHWCVPDGDFVKNPVQFCGQGLTLNEAGEFVPLENLREHLLEKPSLAEQLNRLKSRLEPGEMEHSIWMVHNPPADLGMDICGNGDEAGSPNILQFIAENQPLLGCSGHIHESPHQPGGKWIGLVGDTTWLQPGQVDKRLHDVTLEITENHNIRNIRHSVFGPTSIEFTRFS